MVELHSFVAQRKQYWETTNISPSVGHPLCLAPTHILPTHFLLKFSRVLCSNFTVKWSWNHKSKHFAESYPTIRIQRITPSDVKQFLEKPAFRPVSISTQFHHLNCCVPSPLFARHPLHGYLPVWFVKDKQVGANSQPFYLILTTKAAIKFNIISDNFVYFEFVTWYII